MGIILKISVIFKIKNIAKLINYYKKKGESLPEKTRSHQLTCNIKIQYIVYYEIMKKDYLNELFIINEIMDINKSRWKAISLRLGGERERERS